MAHIHTEANGHDSTVSAFIIREVPGQAPALLMHRHKKLGVWLQFGGHVERTETPWQSLVHEVREEAGYDIDQLHVLQPTIRLRGLTDAVLHPLPVCENTHQFISIAEGHFHSDRSYAFVTDQPPRHVIGEGESSDIQPMTLQELEALPTNDIPESSREIARFVLTDIFTTWERVPAAGFES